MISWVGLSSTTLLTITLVGATLISILYLLRLRRRQVIVPFLPLWRRVVTQNRYQSLFQRLKRLISWLLQLLLLLLFIMALADPRPREELLGGRHIALIIDTSASMQATDGLIASQTTQYTNTSPSTAHQHTTQPQTKHQHTTPSSTNNTKQTAHTPDNISPTAAISRLTEAKHKAHALIRSLAINDQLMLISMDSEVIPLTPFTSDRELLLKQLNSLRCSDTRADLRRALLLAQDSIQGRMRSEIIAISDGNFHRDTLDALHNDGQISLMPHTDKLPKSPANADKKSAPNTPTTADKSKSTAKTKREKAKTKREKAKTKREKAKTKREKAKTKREKAKTKATVDKVEPQKRVDVMALSKIPEARPRKLPHFRWWRVGRDSDNVGIVSLNARQLPSHPMQFAVYVELQNFGEREVEGFLEFYVDDLIMDNLRIVLKPKQKLRHILQRLPAQGQKLGARFRIQKGRDILEIDNRAFAVLPQTQPLRVLLIGEDSLYLQAALFSDAYLNFQRVACGKENSHKQPYDIAIYNDCRPEQALSKGRFLFINPSPQDTPFAMRTKGGQPLWQNNPIITEQMDAHPAMRYISLSDLNVRRTLELRPERGDHSLASSFGKPLILARDRGQMRAIAVGFSLRESDFVLRAAFPLFLRGAFEWLLWGGSSLPPTTYQTGQSWRISTTSASPKTDNAMIYTPDGRKISLPIINGEILISGKYSGFYRIKIGEQERWLAANLSDPTESNIAPATWRESLRPPSTEQSTQEGALTIFGLPIPQPIWLYLLLCAALILGLEWMTYNRRITV
jgi:hypothetical protein